MRVFHRVLALSNVLKRNNFKVYARAPILRIRPSRPKGRGFGTVVQTSGNTIKTKIRNKSYLTYIAGSCFKVIFTEPNDFEGDSPLIK